MPSHLARKEKRTHDHRPEFSPVTPGRSPGKAGDFPERRDAGGIIALIGGAYCQRAGDT